MSRQRERQRVLLAAGLCITCGLQPVYRSQRCETHYTRFLAYNRARYRELHPRGVVTTT